jgi:hypothetical protein
MPILHEFVSRSLTIETGKSESKQESRVLKDASMLFGQGKFSSGEWCAADFCKVYVTVIVQ